MRLLDMFCPGERNMIKSTIQDSRCTGVSQSLEPRRAASTIHARMANFARLSGGKGALHSLRSRLDHRVLAGITTSSWRLARFFAVELKSRSNFGSEGRKNRRTATVHGGGRDVACRSRGDRRQVTTRDFDSGGRKERRSDARRGPHVITT
jgi:hypothetical protein